MDLSLLPENVLRSTLSLLEADDVRTFRATASWANDCFLKFSKHIEKRPTSELCLRRKDEKTLIAIISLAHITTSKWKLEFIDEESDDIFNVVEALKKPGNIKVGNQIRGKLYENLSIFLATLLQLTQLPGMIQLTDLLPEEIHLFTQLITAYCDRGKAPTRVKMQISHPAPQEIKQFIRMTEPKTCSFEISNGSCWSKSLLTVNFFRSFSQFAIKGTGMNPDLVFEFDDKLLEDLEMDRHQWGKTLNLHIEVSTRISHSAAERFIRQTINGKNQRLWGSFQLISPFPETIKNEIFEKGTNRQNDVANFGDICTLRITGNRISIGKGNTEIV